MTFSLQCLVQCKTKTAYKSKNEIKKEKNKNECFLANLLEVSPLKTTRQENEFHQSRKPKDRPLIIIYLVQESCYLNVEAMRLQEEMR